MSTVDTSLREQFEEDALPFLEALWGTALWLTMRRTSAENLVVKTMAQAYRSRQNLSDGVGIKLWLFRILTGEFFGTGFQPYRLGPFLPEPGEGDTFGHVAGRPAPGDMINGRELVELTGIVDGSIKGTITRFRVRSRLIMILHFRERFSYSDIAYITNLRYESVRAVIHRLRRLVPRCLEKPEACDVTAIDGFPKTVALRASSDEG